MDVSLCLPQALDTNDALVCLRNLFCQDITHPIVYNKALEVLRKNKDPVIVTYVLEHFLDAGFNFHETYQGLFGFLFIYGVIHKTAPYLEKFKMKSGGTYQIETKDYGTFHEHKPLRELTITLYDFEKVSSYEKGSGDIIGFRMDSWSPLIHFHKKTCEHETSGSLNFRDSNPRVAWQDLCSFIEETFEEHILAKETSIGD